MTAVVSIMIPAYNRELIIAETIHSALSQTYEHVEVVVVDNASTDKTWQIIQSFSEQDPRVKAFRNESNIGPVRNWLRCVEESTGEYGKILWSDDLIDQDFIAKTLPLLNDNVGFVYTGANIFTESSHLDASTSYLLPLSGIYPTSMYIERALFDKDVPVSPGCAIFRLADIRKNLLLQIPNEIGSDFSMHAIGNDLLLFLLTAKDYDYFGHVAEPLSFFRSHDGSISISSTSGKLPVHYALAKAYFIENFRPSLKDCFAASLQLLLWRYRDSDKYGLVSVSDFFKADVELNKFRLLKEIYGQAITALKRYYNRIL